MVPWTTFEDCVTSLSWYENRAQPVTYLNNYTPLIEIILTMQLQTYLKSSVVIV